MSAVSLQHLIVPRRVAGSSRLLPNHQLLVVSTFSSADDGDDHSSRRRCLFAPRGMCSICHGRSTCCTIQEMESRPMRDKPETMLALEFEGSPAGAPHQICANISSLNGGRPPSPGHPRREKALARRGSSSDDLESDENWAREVESFRDGRGEG